MLLVAPNSTYIDLLYTILVPFIFGIILFLFGAYFFLTDPIMERYYKHFVCPRKGHIPRHHVKTIYEKCNLNYNHYKGFEQLPTTYCERCLSEL